MFETRVAFEPCCDCCSVRQYVKGFFIRFRLFQGASHGKWNYVHDTPPHRREDEQRSGADIWQEDTGPGGEAYGHRDTPGNASRYIAGGCCYQASDTPGWPQADLYVEQATARGIGIVFELDYQFRIEVIDTCNNNTTVDIRFLYERARISMKAPIRKPLQPRLDLGSVDVKPDTAPWPWGVLGCP